MLAALVCEDVALTKLCLCVKCISVVFKLLYFHLFPFEFFTKCPVSISEELNAAKMLNEGAAYAEHCQPFVLLGL